MIRKSEGIVLRTYKHQDSNLIAKVFTREYGLQTFIVPGHRSSRSRSRHSYFQPLSIIEVVFQERANRDLQKLTETRSAFGLVEAQTHPVKLSLGLALLEIFSDTTGDETDPHHYEFLKSIIIYLDRSPDRLIQIFLFFLVHHTRFLGFFPNDESTGRGHVIFVKSEGTIRNSELADAGSGLLRQFLHSELRPRTEEGSCQNIRLDSDQKRQFIRMMFEYYQMHITGFRYPQTMKVFAEVFGA